jgi:hypothetical protein
VRGSASQATRLKGVRLRNFGEGLGFVGEILRAGSGGVLMEHAVADAVHHLIHQGGDSDGDVEREPGHGLGPEFAAGFGDGAGHFCGDHLRGLFSALGEGGGIHAAEIVGGGEKIGFAEDGVDAGDGDGKGLEFDAEAFGEAELCGLGGGVGGEIGQASAGAGAGDDHELAAETVAWLLLFHGDDGPAAAVDGAEEIGLEDLAYVLIVHGVEGAGEAVACVADEGIDATKLMECRCDDAATVVGAGDISRNAEMFARNIGAELLEAIEASGGEDQPRAAGGQIHGQSPADAGTCPRDDRNHVVESAHRADCNAEDGLCAPTIF